MQIYLYVILGPVLLFVFWLYTAQVARTSFPKLTEKRICLLIAHPDDEAMFFAPTVLALAGPELGNHLRILCLSNGNADGLGETRKQELVASALILGLRSAADVLVIEDAAFPDGMNITWEASNIAACLSAALPQATAKQGTRKQVSERSRQNDPPTAAIDVLITFDRNGISGHSNHISLYHGARFWLEELMNGKSGWECPVSLYTLSTTNIARKYISVLDAPLTIIQCVLTTIRNGGSRANNMPRRLMYLNDMIQYRTAQKAMTQAHKSQMLWFRWGWILIGRYMVVNDLRKEKTI